jgi:hypothetical protein
MQKKTSVETILKPSGFPIIWFIVMICVSIITISYMVYNFIRRMKE